MSVRDRRAALIAVGALAALTTAACSGGSSGGSGSADEARDTITVAATDDACDVDASSLEAGTHNFAVTNKGSKVTEFYVYAEGDRIMGEVENIARGWPGT
jgi:iron uptake system component EfeO